MRTDRQTDTRIQSFSKYKLGRIQSRYQVFFEKSNACSEPWDKPFLLQVRTRYEEYNFMAFSFRPVRRSPQNSSENILYNIIRTVDLS